MIQPYFKIYIYTMGNKKYAHSVVNLLKKEIPTFDISDSKVISRDDSEKHENNIKNKMIKSLSRLSPTDQSFYLIMDDRSDVWPGSRDSLLKVYPYVYFQGRDEIMLKSYPDYFKKFTDADLDPFLLFYGKYLKSLHSQYYSDSG